jgi:hypothetical protein
LGLSGILENPRLIQRSPDEDYVAGKIPSVDPVEDAFSNEVLLPPGEIYQEPVNVIAVPVSKLPAVEGLSLGQKLEEAPRLDVRSIPPLGPADSDYTRNSLPTR